MADRVRDRDPSWRPRGGERPRSDADCVKKCGFAAFVVQLLEAIKAVAGIAPASRAGISPVPLTPRSGFPTYFSTRRSRVLRRRQENALVDLSHRRSG